MDTYTVAGARKNFYKLIEQVNRQKKPIVIKLADEKTEAVLLSKAEWDSIQETIYLGNMGVMREVRARDKGFSYPVTAKESIETRKLPEEVEKAIVVAKAEELGLLEDTSEKVTTIQNLRNCWVQ
ncbi:type II toxin-antitoxin system Phd/YefM family antitoxin [Levilactobacillus fuyuanensis]|uniref:Antitoxin n=1 Tax=Levilactobacillus fuyuanensis TaxID=2486022 RepID=A0ABW4H5B3_9LACO|nr:type II toxin-antitoxin system Phd/YefM family antitoxin [Levilactobacillus fuyuanensis]